MIATVTLNPSLDSIITVDRLVLDEANRWTRLDLYAGGKGIDVSRAIYEMGAPTTAYGFIGGSAGRTLEILLDEEGVPFSFTPIRRETRTNFIINDTKNAQQTRIGAPGPRITKRDFERFYQKLTRIMPSPDLLVASGSVPPGIPEDVYSQIILEAKKSGIRTILDTAGPWLVDGLRAKPYLVKPNVHEAETLLKRELPDERAIIKAAFELLGRGVEFAVISRGKDGLIAASRDIVCKAVSPAIKVKSAVGAGDCTVAGLAMKLTYGESLLEACRLGAAMGSAAVMTPGTELARRRDVERILPDIQVWQIPAGDPDRIEFPAD